MSGLIGDLEMKWVNRNFSKISNAAMIIERIVVDLLRSRHNVRGAANNSRVSSVFCTLGLITILPCCGFSSPLYAEFKDPLDVPARLVEGLNKRPIQAVVKVDSRLVAVGARGLMITSDDNGDTWQQSSSPVQSDLVAVNFPTEKDGWVVGHDGVVLHSTDAGKSWQKQLDGRQAKDIFTSYYHSRSSAGGEEALALVERNYASGSSLPLLDVWFKDAEHGYAVGSFGTIIATSNGGETWEPWFDRIDNEESLNLNGINELNGDVYIAAERGTLFKLNPLAGRFEKIETGHDGSFFGLVGSGDVLLVYGLGGTVYRSADQGITWVELNTSSNSSITAGAVLADSHTFVLTNAVGDLLLGNGLGKALSLQKAQKPSRYTGVVSLANDRLLISSLEGMRIEQLHDSSAQK